jgi:hypothetical protein
VLGLFAPHGVLHVTNGLFEGDHVGPEAIVQLLAGLFEWTGGTLRLDVEEVFADDAHGVILLRETGRRATDGAELDVRETHVVHIEDDLVVEFWDLPADADKDAHETFFSNARHQEGFGAATGDTATTRSIATTGSTAMRTLEATDRYSIDGRGTRGGASARIEPAAFWQGAWASALHERGEAAAADAELLGLEPLTIRTDGHDHSLRVRAGRIESSSGTVDDLVVDLDVAAFTDLVQERKSAFGLAIAGRVSGDDRSINMFCAWDPALRSVLDSRSLYRPGDVTLRAMDGGTLDLDQAFELERPGREAAHFLTEAGFLLLKSVFTEADLDAIDADLADAVEGSSPEDGVSWWATTKEGDRYPCRILDFVTKSERLRQLLGSRTFLSIGELLDDGHEPGDPFGEHFSDVTAEGLLKRVDSVDGLVCLPWHKDCERGGHALFCSGLTIGICLTPVDEAHGGLDVIAGSHRSLIYRSQFDELDLPVVRLRAERGDVTVHTSCTVHRSTHPTGAERRVVYTGFALPARPGDLRATVDQSVLARERADIAGHTPRPPAPAGGGSPA